MNRLFYKIKKNLKINKIVMENDGYDFFIEEFLNSMNNPNMCMILIENMCLALIIPDYIAWKFGYLRLLHENNEMSYYKEFHIKIFKINNDWDNHKWSYSTIKFFYKNYEQIENKNIPEIEDIITESQWLKQYIDVEFLRALSWGEEQGVE